jgi:3'-phosphoadenosine 5'-phosphosulfate sulfotransferase (PAPS reductase)/FAD synthetase
MSDPFRIDGPTCISFSGGRTSAYMLWRVLQSNGGLPSDAKVLFANTGKEEEATLRFVRDCGERWGVPITWLEYENPETYSAPVEEQIAEWRFIAMATEPERFNVVDFATASRTGEPYEALIAQRGGVLPNRVARFCSSELKTRTMHRYLRSIGWTEWDTFIGIRADEPRRVTKFRANPHPETKAEWVHMPLANVGIGAQDVGAFWRAQPFDLGLPNMNGKTMHGNCDLCFLKPASQVLSLIAEKPSRAVWWAEQERKAESVATGNANRFRDDRPSYAAMHNQARLQTDAFGYDPDEEAIPCFCGD